MKIEYNGIMYDSDLEIKYEKYLEENDIKHIYHPKVQIKLNKNNKYTPDFITFYNDRVEIIETKGYNQFSFMKDNITHNLMLEKSIDELVEFLNDNGIDNSELEGKDIVYKKIKYLKAYGFVDFNFKNPNTLANKRKNTIESQKEELKSLRLYKKKCERYFSYLKKDKLTKQQLEWKNTFEKENI